MKFEVESEEDTPATFDDLSAGDVFTLSSLTDGFVYMKMNGNGKSVRLCTPGGNLVGAIHSLTGTEIVARYEARLVLTPV